MDKSLDELLQDVPAAVRDSINQLIEETVTAETEIKVQNERSKFTAETDLLKSKIQTKQEELAGAKTARPGTGGMRTGKSTTGLSKIPGINKGPFEQSNTNKTDATAKTGTSIRSRLTSGLNKIMPRKSNVKEADST